MANTERLIVVCGMSGSGKTTLAKAISAKTGGIRLSADDWMIHLGIDIWDSGMRARIESLQWAQAKELLRLGNTVIVEWGSWSIEPQDLDLPDPAP